MGDAKSFIPLVHVVRRGAVKSTFDIGHNEDETLPLRAQAVQHCCEHYESLLAPPAATTVKELLAVHAAVSLGWRRWVVGRGMTQECVFDFLSHKRR